MILYHVTTRDNIDSIERRGLWPECAEGAYAAVWLVTSHGIEAGRRHAMARHHCRSTDVAVIEVTIPKSWLHFPGGVYRYTTYHVPAESCRCLTPAT